MKLLFIFLGVVLGVILFLGILALILYGNLKSAFRKLGFNVNNLSDMTDEMARIKEENSTRARSISGMTSLLLPTIRKDFPEFNENELFSMCESSLRKIFRATEELNCDLVNDMPLIRNSVANIIEDYKNANLTVHYDDIDFHKFAISNYVRKDGVATVTVTASVGYFYKKLKDNKIIEGDVKFKKQTRYQCEYIYIYDETKVSSDAKVLAINCPNCGAAISTLGHKFCEYCGTGVKEVNLKSWELSSYEEY